MLVVYDGDAQCACPEQSGTTTPLDKVSMIYVYTSTDPVRIADSLSSSNSTATTTGESNSLTGATARSSPNGPMRSQNEIGTTKV